MFYDNTESKVVLFFKFRLGVALLTTRVFNICAFAATTKNPELNCQVQLAFDWLVQLLILIYSATDWPVYNIEKSLDSNRKCQLDLSKCEKYSLDLIKVNKVK